MSEMRELTAEEIDDDAGGLTIGPFTVEASDGLFAITVGGYGIWGGHGCIGVLTPDRVLGACVR
jgi:hypothetical protein